MFLKYIEEKRQKLQAFCVSEEPARLLFEDLSNRQRNQQVTKLDQILNRLEDKGITRGIAIQFFRRLEDIGCGQYVEGRKGHPSRFVWEDDLITVGRVARGEAGQIESLNSEEEEAANEARQARDFEHIFRLRGDFVVRLRLPSDLTDKEAQRLGGFLKTLSME